MEGARRRPSSAEEEGHRRARLHRARFVQGVADSDAFKPLVLVITSAGARAAAAGNGGLALADLLTPFGTIRGSIPVRNKERSYHLKQFGVRFVDVGDLMPGSARNSPAFDAGLRALVRHHPPGAGGGLTPRDAAVARVDGPQLHCARDIGKFLKRSASASTAAGGASQAGDMAPWWTAAVREVADVGLRGQQWDMFCHPILLLYVVSTVEPAGAKDPAAQAAAMLEPRNLPKVMTSGQYNRNVPSMVLVLHDNIAAAAIDPVAVKRQVCSTTGMHTEAVKVLRMNSLAPDGRQNQEQPDLWTPCMSWSARVAAAERLDRAKLEHPGGAIGAANSVAATNTPPVNGHRPGGLLSPEDMIGFQKFASELVESTVVRQLESRIFSLTSSVAKSRQGFMNTLKSWRRKAKDLTGARA